MHISTGIMASSFQAPVNKYAMLDTVGDILTSLDGTTWVKSSLTNLTANGALGDSNIPYNSASTEWLCADILGNVYRVNLAATIVNSTITGPVDCAACYGIDYKAGNTTIIISGQDTTPNAAIWWTSNFSTWHKVIILSGNRFAASVRYDSGANQWNLYEAITSTAYYSVNDGTSWTAATGAGGGATVGRQCLQVGATNVILAPFSTAAAGDINISTNGTVYTGTIIKNSGLTTMAGTVKGFAYQASSGLYLCAGNAAAGGTNAIATSTTPSTLNSWTLFNNPSAALQVMGAMQGGGNWFIFGGSSSGILVSSSNATSYSAATISGTGTSPIQAMGTTTA